MTRAGERGTMKGRSRVNRRRVRAIVVLALLLVGPIAVLAGGPLALIAYDKAHIVSVTGRVDSAESSLASTRSSKGIGSSSTQVFIESSCGELILERGVTAVNGKRIAESFRAGDRYDFEIGEASYRFREFLSAVHVARVVYACQRSGAQ